MFGANQKPEDLKEKQTEAEKKSKILRGMFKEARKVIAPLDKTIEVLRADLLTTIQVDDDITNLDREINVRQLLNQLESIKLKVKIPRHLVTCNIDEKIQIILNEALFAAIDKCDSNVVLLLLQYGANPNVEMANPDPGILNIPLIRAINRMSLDCVRTLLKYGANPVYKHEQYACPIDFACLMKTHAIFDELMVASLGSDYIYSDTFKKRLVRSSLQCINLYLDYGCEYDATKGRNVLNSKFYLKAFSLLVELNDNCLEIVALIKRIFRECETEIMVEHYFNYLFNCIFVNASWAIIESDLHKQLSAFQFERLISFALSSKVVNLKLVNYFLELLTIPFSRISGFKNRQETFDEISLLGNVLDNKVSQVIISLRENESVYNLLLNFVLTRCIENEAYLKHLIYILDTDGVRGVDCDKLGQKELAFLASYLHSWLNDPESILHGLLLPDRITDLYAVRDRIFSYMYPQLANAIIALCDDVNTDLIITAMVIDHYKQIKSAEPAELLPQSITAVLEHIRLRCIQETYPAFQEIYTYLEVGEKLITNVEKVVNTEAKEVVIPMPDYLAEQFAELSEKLTDAVEALIKINWIPEPLEETAEIRLAALQEKLFIGLNELPDERPIIIRSTCFSLFSENQDDTKTLPLPSQNPHTRNVNR